MQKKEKLNVINPSNAKVLAQLSTDDRRSALGKIKDARKLFCDHSRHIKRYERTAILEKLATAIELDCEAFAITIAQEGGKPLMDARVEVTRAIAGIRMAVAAVNEHRGKVIPLGHQGASANRLNFTEVFPRGVVLAFSAFNHPLNLIVHQIIPAFATGCPCVVKPAPDTPLSCLRLIDAMYDAGVPRDYIQAVITPDLDVASALVQSSEIAFFSFIGSAKVGWMLRAQLQPGVRCALEHGGVAPCIVTASADLDKAVPAITKGGFYHAGQVCVSTQRVYVDKSIFTDFCNQLTVAVSALKMGDAADEQVEVGPLIRPQEAARVHEWVEEARSFGATVAVGGQPPEGNFYQPTLLLSPSPEAKVSRQEIFGPVVCVYPVENLDGALSEVNIESFAFQASIFTEQLDDVYRAYDKINASAIMVNDHTAFRDDVMPFAGLDASGLGVGGIPYTVEELQFEKMMILKK